MAGNRAARRMADRLMGGKLAETIERYRGADVSWAAISRILLADFGVEVTAETLSTWATDLGIGDDQREAEAAAQ